MNTDQQVTLLDRLGRYDDLVEVGIGNCPQVAGRLVERSCRVTATDIDSRSVPGEVSFVRDDVTDPDLPNYRGVDAIYALNCPPELQRPLAKIARTVDADCLFTTLGGDPALVDTTPETVSDDTLFRLNR